MRRAHKWWARWKTSFDFSFLVLLTIYAIFMAAVWLHTVKWTIFALEKVKQMEAFLWVIPLSWYFPVLHLILSFFVMWFPASQSIFTHRQSSSPRLTHCIRKNDFFILSSWSATKKTQTLILIIVLKRIFIHKIKVEKHEFMVHS